MYDLDDLGDAVDAHPLQRPVELSQLDDRAHALRRRRLQTRMVTTGICSVVVGALLLGGFVLSGSPRPADLGVDTGEGAGPASSIDEPSVASSLVAAPASEAHRYLLVDGLPEELQGATADVWTDAIGYVEPDRPGWGRELEPFVRSPGRRSRPPRPAARIDLAGVEGRLHQPRRRLGPRHVATNQSVSVAVLAGERFDPASVVEVPASTRGGRGVDALAGPDARPSPPAVEELNGMRWAFYDGGCPVAELAARRRRRGCRCARPRPIGGTDDALIVVTVESGSEPVTDARAVAAGLRWVAAPDWQAVTTTWPTDGSIRPETDTQARVQVSVLDGPIIRGLVTASESDWAADVPAGSARRSWRGATRSSCGASVRRTTGPTGGVGGCSTSRPRRRIRRWPRPSRRCSISPGGPI